MIERHPEKASESIIRGAVKENSVDKWYTYDQQFRLRVSKDDTKKWSSIDGFLWLRSATGLARLGLGRLPRPLGIFQLL
jgi:hypothetical protein